MVKEVDAKSKCNQDSFSLTEFDLNLDPAGQYENCRPRSRPQLHVTGGAVSGKLVGISPKEKDNDHGSR